MGMVSMKVGFFFWGGGGTQKERERESLRDLVGMLCLGSD